jgi:hypothetical protein
VTIRQLPAKSCVIEVSPLLRELIVAAVRVPLDYQDGSRGDRLMRVLVDEMQESDVLPLHLPVPGDARIKRICEAITERPSDTSTAAQWPSGLKLDIAALPKSAQFRKV